MTEKVDGEAFARLYPQEYYSKFIAQDLRPDGRLLLQERALSITMGVVGTADSSALVRIGKTSALAGIKLEVAQPDDERPGEGILAVQVEMPPLCSAASQPGRPSPEAALLTERLSDLLDDPALLDPRQLCISGGRAVWVVYCDVYIMDADGAVADAVTLAALAALRALRLPAVAVNPDGNVVRGEGGAQAVALELGPLPVPLTCGVFEGKLVVDPAASEEALMVGGLHVLVDPSGNLRGAWRKSGEVAHFVFA